MRTGLLTLSCAMALACLPQVGPLIDSGTPLMTGDGGMDAGNPGCPGFASCTTYTDLTDAGSTRTVAFPVNGNFYAPNCLRVRAGQTVTFNGEFSMHPLTQECGPVDNVLTALTGATMDFTLVTPGTYGFYCFNHGSAAGTGMSGAIEVVP